MQPPPQNLTDVGPNAAHFTKTNINNYRPVFQVVTVIWSVIVFAESHINFQPGGYFEFACSTKTGLTAEWYDQFLNNSVSVSALNLNIKRKFGNCFANMLKFCIEI